MKRWCVVVPSNRPSRLAEFVKAWTPLIRKHRVDLIVVEDREPWPGIPDFIPKRTDMIRSWGFYQAWKANEYTFTLSLDDDVLPHPDFDVFEEYEREFFRARHHAPYLSVGSFTDTKLEMRGFPRRAAGKLVSAQYGGWYGVPDLGADTQLEHPVTDAKFAPWVIPVPDGAATTCCAMNFAFRTDLTPIFWQFPLVDGKFNRWGDIWSGLVQKRVLDSIGEVMLINGRASVIHDRASDPNVNWEKEEPGIAPNEWAWRSMLPMEIRDPIGAFRVATSQISHTIWRDDEENRARFLEARDEWLKLFA